MKPTLLQKISEYLGSCIHSLSLSMYRQSFYRTIKVLDPTHFFSYGGDMLTPDGCKTGRFMSYKKSLL